MEALYRRFRIDREPMSLADIGAARESDPTIDDQDLAMISQVGVSKPTVDPCRQETRARKPIVSISRTIFGRLYFDPTSSISTRMSTPRL